MNEIQKLKVEHARYKAALHEIHTVYVECSNAYQVADTALNPPPPPPVTLDELKAALNRYNEVSPLRGFYSIHFFRDESGSIRDGGDDRVFSFSTLREAVDFLN